MAPDFRLVGYVAADGKLRLLWQPLAAVGPYDLYIHLLDGSGKQVAQLDALAWPAEEGPADDYLLMTQVALNVAPGRYSAEAGAVHRSSANLGQLIGGPIGEVARIPIEIPGNG